MMTILFAGGIGDWIALNRYIFREVWNEIDTVYLACPEHQAIRQLIRAQSEGCANPAVVCLWDSWCNAGDSSPGRIDCKETLLHLLPSKALRKKLQATEDWCVEPALRRIETDRLTPCQSFFASICVAKINQFCLPSEYM